jgi:hypothetical protein
MDITAAYLLTACTYCTSSCHEVCLLLLLTRSGHHFYNIWQCEKEELATVKKTLTPPTHFILPFHPRSANDSQPYSDSFGNVLRCIGLYTFLKEYSIPLVRYPAGDSFAYWAKQKRNSLGMTIGKKQDERNIGNSELWWVNNIRLQW